MNLEYSKAKKPTRRIGAERMAEYGALERNFVVFEADIGKSTYSCLFRERFPERYFQMGIAEGNMMTAAAGMAAEGRTVVVAGYGVFLTLRAIESVRSFICYPNLNVKLFASHGGVTAAVDGVTHQSTEDIACMSTLPNMKVLVPADTVAARACFDIAMTAQGPVYLRLMREGFLDVYPDNTEFVLGGSHVLRTGDDVTIASYGDILFQALEAAKRLEEQGVSAEVLDLYSVKPVDWNAVKTSVAKTGALVVAENHQLRNGLDYELAFRLAAGGISVPFKALGLDDTFAETGEYSKIVEKYGISAAAIEEAARAAAGRKSRV